MRKRSGQVHSRESSATLQLTVSLLYLYPRMHLIFMYYCVIILTIRVTGTDMNKNSCKAAESTIYRTILRMAVAAGSLEKGQKGYGRK